MDGLGAKEEKGGGGGGGIEGSEGAEKVVGNKLADGPGRGGWLKIARSNNVVPTVVLRNCLCIRSMPTKFD